MASLKLCPALLSIALGLLGGTNAHLLAEAARPCQIEVVEKGCGWPVPLVELRTTHNVRFVTDNAGIIAFDLPELMGVETWFEVLGHGYEIPADGLGMRGVRLTPQPGAKLNVEVERKNVAMRIGRLTGAGRFAESQKLGLGNPDAESGVLGCDSVQNAVYQGNLFWLWGDTTLARYPLGIFNATAARTPLNPLTSRQPPLQIGFNIFSESRNHPRGVADIPGDGPTWITALVALTNQAGTARLVGTYMKIRQPMDAYEWGLCVWNDAKEKFERHQILWKESETKSRPPALPDGHAVFWSDGKTNWILFGNPLPTLRCPATFEAWQDRSTWETLSPQTNLLSAADGAPVKLHSGAIAWNAWRKRWVTIFMEAFGKPSAFGEVWYAEANSPLGPWGKAVKVLSHDNYTFYNPQLHPEFSSKGSPGLFFEGTFSQAFADHPAATPRYDYNQMLYRLDLDSAALRAAQDSIAVERK